ncbi:MAG: hypothetical protein M0Z51_16875 [Propionibacterium sp.]|nr:hypothetical protein [Propionibacterium sp.]
MTDGPVYALPFVSADIAEAARKSGASETSIRVAIASGDLTAYYLGDRSTKPLIRAVDLDAWVRSLPTTRGNRRTA